MNLTYFTFQGLLASLRESLRKIHQYEKYNSIISLETEQTEILRNAIRDVSLIQ